MCVVLAACGGSHAIDTKREPALVVLDAGAEPRQLLRFAPTVHVPERIETTYKVRAATAFTNTVLETGHRSADYPAVKVVERAEVTGIDANGDALVGSEIEDAQVLEDLIDPKLRDSLVAQASQLKGSHGSWRRSPAGTVADVIYRAPQASPALRKRLEDMSDMVQALAAPLPDVPVGVGASWVVTSRTTVSRVTWDRKATYRLRDLTGGTAVLDATIEMHAGSQALSVEPNATLRLTSGSASGTGELSISLGGVFATGDTRTTSEMNYTIVRGHQRITSTMQTEWTVTARALPRDTDRAATSQ